MSGFKPRNRNPAFPGSGVKKPAPVPIGPEDLEGASSEGVCFTGSRSGGNISSISDKEPIFGLNQRRKKIGRKYD